jgi:hypothetical protein
MRSGDFATRAKTASEVISYRPHRGQFVSLTCCALRKDEAG